MRIPSGKSDVYIYFVAKDADGARLTGLSSFTVYRSRNGAAEVQMTTPTITEIDTTNMPGVYALLVDEDTTITSGADSEEMAFHITQASMVAVTRTVELYRRTYTSGETFDDAEVTAIKAKTDNLPSDPADASVIAGRFDTLDTSVGDLPTNAELATALAGADDAVLAAIGALNDLSASETAVAVWDALLASHQVADSFGEFVQAITSGSGLDAAGVRAAIGLASANLDTQLDALPTNTELGTALAAADDAVLAAIAALNNLSAAQVNAEVDTALADYDGPTHAELTAELATADDAVLAQVALVKAKTDNLPSDPADASVIAARFDTLDTSVADLPTNAELATALGTADDAVLAQVALVKAKTDLIPASPAATSDIPSANAIRDAVFAQTIESYSFLENMRGFEAVMLGPWTKVSDTITFRNAGDTRDVVVADVDDDARSNVVVDLTP